MIDFTTMPRKNKAYAGANGSKIAIVYFRLLTPKITGTPKIQIRSEERTGRPLNAAQQQDGVRPAALF